MKPITEQRRQELIERLEVYIRTAKSFIRIGMASEEDLFNLQVREIALASLTAVPEVSEIESVHPENGNIIIHLRSGGLKNISPEDIAEYEMIETEKFYAAPPVPVIKLPGTVEFNKQSKTLAFDKGFSVGFNECIEEIKNLNGLGE